MSPHPILGRPFFCLPSLGAFVPEKQELNPVVRGQPPAVQPAIEIGPGHPLQKLPTPYREREWVVLVSGVKWILLVFPSDEFLDDRLPELPELRHFAAPLHGLGYSLVSIHSTEANDFMTRGPFVRETWRNLVAVVLFDPDFPPPPGPLSPPPTITTLSEYVHTGGLLIIAGHFQNAFSDPLCFRRFAQDMGLTWGVGSWGQSASVVCCVGNMEIIAQGSSLEAHQDVGGTRPLMVDPNSGIYEENIASGAFVTNVDTGDVWYQRVSLGVYGGTEALIVISRVCNGQVGFVGEMGLGDGSQLAMVAMCQWHTSRTQ